MKKINLIVASIALSVTSTLSAQFKLDTMINNQSNYKQEQQSVKEAKFKTLSDAQNFIKDMESIADANPQSNYYLGLFYMNDHQLDNGVFKADIEKGLKRITMSANAGYGTASLYLAVYFTKNKEYDAAISALRKILLDSRFVTAKMKLNAAKQFSAIVLDNKKDNQRLLQEALNYLYSSESYKQDAEAEFFIANIYKNLNNEEFANRYLTIACTKPNAPIKIKKMCETYK